MFTGLVEAKGTLLRRVERAKEARLVLRHALASAATDPIVLGESIAIDGVCLTVDRLHEDTFEVDASSETLEKTTLGGIAIGAEVNLERAVAVGSRLGGHIVSGHVDGVGRVVEVTQVGGSTRVAFEAPVELACFVAPKGSICVSGVSLTVNNVSGPKFDVMLIPHTQEKTSLGTLRVGTRVNLEVDVLARYVARLLESGRTSSNDEALLGRLRASGYV